MRRTAVLESRLFQSGHQFETEVLGRCSAPCRSYVQRQECFELVRKHQPARKTETLCRLEREFAKRVGGRVCFYTAVGSPLDVFHGIDGFCEYCGRIVTFDVTENPEKVVGKADVVIHPDDLERIEFLLVRIASVFLANQSRLAYS